MKLKKEGKEGGRKREERVVVGPGEEEGRDWEGKPSAPNRGLDLWSYSSERYPYARC